MVSSDVRDSDVAKFAGTGSSKGFAGDLAVHVHAWPMLSKGIQKSGRQFEPEARPCIDEASAGVPSQIASHEAKSKLEGWEVIEAWAGLPEPLRAAILAIVRSDRAGKEGR
jgi:hypothetical protein